MICGGRYGRTIFEVVTDEDGLPEIVGSKVRKITFLDVTAEDDLAAIYRTPKEGVKADVARIRLSLCRRSPWVDRAYDPIARLRLYLPGALVCGPGAWPGFAHHAL